MAGGRGGGASEVIERPTAARGAPHGRPGHGRGGEKGGGAPEAWGRPAAPDPVAPASGPGGAGGAAAKKRGGRPVAVEPATPSSKQGGGRPTASKPGGVGRRRPIWPPRCQIRADPTMVAVPSPHGGGAIGKREEEAVGDEKEKTGLAGGGSPAMEAAVTAPVAGEKRGEGGEPKADTMKEELDRFLSLELGG
ncbi:hypothetical protein GUJ93_ZPchr0009g1454 [Zizania palustris]|uniref:Uncharacterized protein n=1 Tax=Zizania palustris TaxID=103762 RepID=A0A8J5VKL9_ZIZPA|nr:hypothetical protein GUJ93_ZPchr0009g1454 [Zizania palustris]